MRNIRKLLALALAAGMIAGMNLTAMAASGTPIGPIEVVWSDLHITASGNLSWKMEVPEQYKELKVQKYTIKLDRMNNAIWGTDYRTVTATECPKEITYSAVGIYRFRIMATFVGGITTNYSGYSNEVSVTKDDLSTGSGTGGTTGGPGTSGTSISSGSSGGPGVVSTTQGGQVPDWAEKTGQWFQQDGKWYYRNNGEIYKNKWACIYNPYAKTGLGQRAYDWFCFDENGQMRTGWYVDPAGNVFYLNPVSNGSKGKMVTGWQQIDGYWYYFNQTEGSGSMGAMVTNATVDGYRLDAAGRRVS